MVSVSVLIKGYFIAHICPKFSTAIQIGSLSQIVVT